MQLLYKDIICHELFLHFLNFFIRFWKPTKKFQISPRFTEKGYCLKVFVVKRDLIIFKQLGKNSSCILVMLWCEIKAHCIQLGSLWLTIFRYIYTALNHTGLSSIYLFMTISLLRFLKLNLVVAITLLFILNQNKLCS